MDVAKVYEEMEDSRMDRLAKVSKTLLADQKEPPVGRQTDGWWHEYEVFVSVGGLLVTAGSFYTKWTAADLETIRSKAVNIAEGKGALTKVIHHVIISSEVLLDGSLPSAKTEGKSE